MARARKYALELLEGRCGWLFESGRPAVAADLVFWRRCVSTVRQVEANESPLALRGGIVYFAFVTNGYSRAIRWLAAQAGTSRPALAMAEWDVSPSMSSGQRMAQRMLSAHVGHTL
jgi:hypothetical protein